MELVAWPNDVLTKRAVGVLIPSTVTAAFPKMVEIMTKNRGCGLAAPQVGISRRFFIVRENIHADIRVFVNPKLSEGEGEEVGIEGCLSLPHEFYKVPRFESVRITATGLHGERIDEVATGHFARILQHENDHLDGKLINRFESFPTG